MSDAPEAEPAPESAPEPVPEPEPMPQYVPGPALPVTHRRRRAWYLLAVPVGFLLIATPVYLVWAGYFRTIGQQTAYNRVNKATQSMVRALGLDPAQHPTLASVTHCDNGMGGWHHWQLDGSSTLHATPDQAVVLAKRMEVNLLMAGDFDVHLTVKGPEVRVSGHLDHTGIYLTYSPADYKDELIFGASTKCEVAVGPHDFDNDNGYRLTDDQGHLLPSPGYGSPTG